MEEFEKLLNDFLKDTEAIPEQYKKVGMDLIKMRRIYKELMVVNTVYDKNGARSYLRLVKTKYMDDSENSLSPINPKEYQNLYTLKIVAENAEEEETTMKADSLEKEAVREFVPTRLIMNKEECLFALYSKQLIVAGRLPYKQEESTESTIELRIVGRAFAKGSGREILKVEFHPLNGSYIGVLTTQGMFYLYNLTSDIDKAEQDFELLKKYSGGALDNKKLLSSFCFGNTKNYSWNAFTVFFLLSNGDVYSLCPVVPGSIHIEPMFINVLEEIVQRERGENNKLHHLKQEFVRLLKEAEPIDIRDHCIILDIDTLHALKPMTQGPVKIYKNVAAEAIQRSYVDLISFDYFPYIYLLTTNKGTIDIAVSWTDSNPMFRSNARIGMGLHEFKVVPCNSLWIVFSQVLISPETQPTLYWNMKDPFIWFAGVEGNMYQVTNSWLHEIQKQSFEIPQKMDKEFIKKLEGLQVVLVAKGDSKQGSYLGAEIIDDYLILIRSTAKCIQGRIFNIYNAIAPNDLKRKVKKIEAKPEIDRFGGESKFKPIDYKALTAIEPFLLKEEEKNVEPLDVMEYLQKILPGYFSLTKRDAERKILQEDINIIKKHEDNLAQLLRDLDSKIKTLEKNKAEINVLSKEVEATNVY